MDDIPYSLPGSVPGFYGSYGSYGSESRPRALSTPLVELPDNNEADIFTVIYTKLQRAMRSPNDEQLKPFIIQEDLDEIWANQRYMDKFLQRTSTSSVGESTIRSMAKILSTVILINASDTLVALSRHLIRDSSTIIMDTDMPLSRDQIPFLNTRFQNAFLEHQYTFLPYVIDESPTSTRHLLESRWRPPFETYTRNRVCGPYGVFDHINIPKGYFHGMNGELVSSLCDNTAISTNLASILL
jgi:hypothetical protein